MSWATGQKAIIQDIEPEELLPELLDIGPGDRESEVQWRCIRSAKQSSRSSQSTPFSQCNHYDNETFDTYGPFRPKICTAKAAEKSAIVEPCKQSVNARNDGLR
jgi:hypothetical protein